MTAARVIIWRHGRTEWNVDARFQGQADLPLDQVGYAQAVRAAEVLAAYRPAAVYSSDLSRSYQTAAVLAERDGLHMVPSFHPDLVDGVSTYPVELFQAVPDLDVVYVPIGLGSGACAFLQARHALGLKTRIVGVVSAHAPAYALSFEAGEPVSHPVSTALADGLACSTPDPTALEAIRAGVDHIVQVTDDEIGAAMRTLFVSTHNLAEGAGAAGWAAAWKERESLAGHRVAVVLTGGNVDADVFARQLQR